MNAKLIIPIAVAAGLCGAPAMAQTLTTVRIAIGLVRPVFAVSPPGDTQRLFIVEQRGSDGIAGRGNIRILNLSNNTLNAAPFLSVQPVSTSTEEGLLGLAFDPNYSSNGFLYVHYTGPDTTVNIVRYHISANPDIADAASATPVLVQSHPFGNHNGGWIAFGPDGYLYIAMGDGGSGCDPNGNAQNLGSLLGKILRINVAALPYTIPPTNPFVGQAGARGEVWAYGLRNPWRDSFDRVTGELYIGDVGEAQQEEIDIQPVGAGGRNYGWNCREGLVCSTGSGCATPAVCPSCVLANAVEPVWSYPHTMGCAITGGYVYRGAAMPGLRGTYFFADFCSAHVWTFRYSGQSIGAVTDRAAELAVSGFTIDQISSFGQDAAGELYIVDQGGGEIYRIIPRCAPNCDGSTTPPILNINDFLCFLNQVSAGSMYANCDGSTVAPVVNINDFNCFLNRFVAGCS